MDILYDEGEDLGTVNIQRCVQTLREQRVNMVQTKVCPVTDCLKSNSDDSAAFIYAYLSFFSY